MRGVNWKTNGYAVILTLSMSALMSRGIFELYSSKFAGYIAGILSIILIVTMPLVLPFLKKQERIRQPDKYLLVFTTIYTIAVLSSLIATAAHGSTIQIGILYSALHIFLLFGILILCKNSGLSYRNLYSPIIIPGVIVGTTGFLQFFGIAEFPGSWEYGDFTRISGSLGSKQHFSFASAALGMMLVWLYSKTGKTSTLVVALPLLALTFLSMSRNGVPIIVGTLLLYFIFNNKKISIRSLSLILIIPAFLVSVGIIYFPSLLKAVSDRALSISSLNELANNRRINAWFVGITEFANGPIFVGVETGLYSQSGEVLGMERSMHYESALIQQFANFGIFGGLSFVFFFIVFCASISDKYLRSIAIMIFLSYMYYPGSESLPVIATWMIVSIAICATKNGDEWQFDSRRRPRNHYF